MPISLLHTVFTSLNVYVGYIHIWLKLSKVHILPFHIHLKTPTPILVHINNVPS